MTNLNSFCSGEEEGVNKNMEVLNDLGYEIRVLSKDNNNRTNAPSIYKKSRKKSRKKSTKKRTKSRNREKAKKARKKRVSNYKRVIKQRRRKTIAAAVVDYNQHNLQALYQIINTKFTRVNILQGDLKFVYILLYKPKSFDDPETVAVQEVGKLNLERVRDLLELSNNDIINCGVSESVENKKLPEYCGNCIYQNQAGVIRLNLHEIITGGLINGRSACIWKKYTNILWHTHPLTSRPWPSGEDIAKIIKWRPGVTIDKLPIVSLIFTKWGIWQIVSATNNRIDAAAIDVPKINNIGSTIFEEKWTCVDNFRDADWRESITNHVNHYTVTLMTEFDSLNPRKNGGGFITFTFWDNIAHNNFTYDCYIPNSDTSRA